MEKSECLKRTPKKTLQAVQKALLDSKAENKQLAAENAALREQTASKELGWRQEKKKFLDERDSLVSNLFLARNNMYGLVKDVESARADVKRLFTQIQLMDIQMKTTKTMIHQSETQWTTKFQALKDCLTCELAAKEESFKKTQELQKHSREMEEKWLATEEEWLNKESKMEEEMKLLKMKTNEEVVCSLKESLRCQQKETEKVKTSWKAEQDKVNEMKLSFDKTVININADWESRWLVRQEEVVGELKTLQQDCENKASQVIQQKDDVITSVRKEMMALTEGYMAELKTTKTMIHQSETEWTTKFQALQDCLTCELAAKEESFKKTQELQKHSREMEEEMKLLSQQNVELQELASKTDKEKAKLKKEAKKEMEKRLKRERKEERERAKKEKKENDNKEKERVKREKQEKKERAKREKKDIEKRD